MNDGVRAGLICWVPVNLVIWLHTLCPLDFFLCFVLFLSKNDTFAFPTLAFQSKCIFLPAIQSLLSLLERL